MSNETQRTMKQTDAVLFRLPPELNAGLRDLAAKEDRTVSAQIRVLIRDAIELQAESRKMPEKTENE